MEWESDDKVLKSVGGEKLGDGRTGIRVNGWEIESRKSSILTSSLRQQWEEKLKTSHLPQMVFGESFLVLTQVNSDVKIQFNAFDALCGWKQEALSPVQIPAAAKWKFHNKPADQVILDYDYTFTTPYCGSADTEVSPEKSGGGAFYWEDCDTQIDIIALASKEPILFYDEVILYEDELDDNGVSILTVKVRVMPSGWFLLLRFWLRVDGVLMRLRETRMHCIFKQSKEPVILREICWRESTFSALSSKGYPKDSAAYGDPDIIRDGLPIIKRNTQKLAIS